MSNPIIRCPDCGHHLTDELDQRIRALEAERLRPVPEPPLNLYAPKRGRA